jgi:transposase
MNPTQPNGTGEPGEPEFAAWVAIDWADEKHYWSLRAADGQEVERGMVDNTPEAMDVWMLGWELRFQGRPIAVAMEQKRGAVVIMLAKYGQVHLYPVHPSTLSNYRHAWYPSKSKNDLKDADLLLEIVTQHRDRLRRLDPETAALRRLQCEVENRRKLVDERTALSNRLTATLKLYFPQILHWFGNVASALVGDWLEQWPSLQDLQKARPARVEKFLRAHGCRDEHRIEELLLQIRTAVAATGDPVVIGPAQCLARVWIRQIAVLRQAIQEMDNTIAELAAQQEDWHIFASLPGAGPVLAPRLMAALGTRRERFASAVDLQCFSGIAPVKEASGNTQWIHMRWACPKFLRQTFHEWAACSIPQCAWARAYYDDLKARGKPHHVAVRALAFKWIRILYRCWKDRQPYRDEVYLASLAQRRKSALLPLARAVQMP